MEEYGDQTSLIDSGKIAARLSAAPGKEKREKDNMGSSGAGKSTTPDDPMLSLSCKNQFQILDFQCFLNRIIENWQLKIYNL
jgi:hypothetical protein